MKPRNCLALVVTSVLALGCASAHAQDEQGAGQQPAPQQPPVADGQRDRPSPDEARLAVRQAEERLRAAALQADAAATRLGDLKGAGRGPDNPDFAEAARAADEARKAFDVAREEHMKRAHDAEFQLARYQRGGMRPSQGGPDDRIDERVRHAAVDALSAHGPHDRDAMRGPGPSMEERLAQIERAVHEMREMFERHGVPQDARERGEREMRERRGDGALGGEHFKVRVERLEGGVAGRDGGIQPGSVFVVGPRLELADRPPVPRPLRFVGGVVVGPDGQVVEGARVQLAAAGDEMAAHMKQMHDQMEEHMRQAQDQMQDLKKALAETQAALKAAQTELEALRAKK